MSYAVLSYHPDVGTFRGTRGAWRVEDYRHVEAPVHAHPEVGLLKDLGPARPKKVLFIDVARPLRRGTWVNPTKLLRELLAARRPNPSRLHLINHQP